MSGRVICMGAWLDGCMKNGSKRLLKSIHTAAPDFITYNHPVIQSFLGTCGG